MLKANVTQEILSIIKDNEDIKEVYFDADGKIHFNQFDGFKININGVKIPTNKKVGGHEQKEIIGTITRDEILAGNKKSKQSETAL